MSVKVLIENLIRARAAEDAACVAHNEATAASRAAFLELDAAAGEPGTYCIRLYIGGEYRTYSCQLALGFIDTKQLTDL